MNKPENQILVIFGASGDLTRRKLIPALYSLDLQDLLPEKFAIIGVSRAGLTDEGFRATMREGLAQYSGEKDQSRFDDFLKRIYYQSVNAHDSSSYRG